MMFFDKLWHRFEIVEGTPRIWYVLKALIEWWQQVSNFGLFVFLSCGFAPFANLRNACNL